MPDKKALQKIIDDPRTKKAMQSNSPERQALAKTILKYRKPVQKVYKSLLPGEKLLMDAIANKLRKNEKLDKNDIKDLSSFTQRYTQEIDPASYKNMYKYERNSSLQGGLLAFALIPWAAKGLATQFSGPLVGLAAGVVSFPPAVIFGTAALAGLSLGMEIYSAYKGIKNWIMRIRGTDKIDTDQLKSVLKHQPLSHVHAYYISADNDNSEATVDTILKATAKAILTVKINPEDLMKAA